MFNLREIRKEISQHPDYEKLLYCKGFVITDDNTLKKEEVSESWEVQKFGKYWVFHDSNLPIYICKDLLLIGHAYNPYDGDFDEKSILSKLAALDEIDFWKYEADLAGQYVMARLEESGDVSHWSDCAGMLISYYGNINGKYYITSHVNIVASHIGLAEDPYVTKLKNSRYFKLFGIVLPGDLSPYREMKRTVPNHKYQSNGTLKRFYPIQPITECSTEYEYGEVLSEASSILKQSLALCAKKWPGKAAISVTGGKDSGVTLASANGAYDAFKYFSYISKPEEAVDAYAAQKICSELGLEHRIISIPEENDEFDDYICMKELVAFNGGSIGYLKSNEVRKRATFLHMEKDFEVEIKSWVDEISRAYWNKKYNKTSFPKKPTGRYLATLYKVFIENRLLFAETSKVFKKYIAEYMTDEDISLMGSWLTLWSWEFGHSAGEGQHMTDEQTLTFDVTVPFNNRHLMSTMLRPKLQDRINDRLQKDIIKRNNPKQAAIGVDVVNAAHTSRRAFMERAYLEINSHSLI